MSQIDSSGSPVMDSPSGNFCVPIKPSIPSTLLFWHGDQAGYIHGQSATIIAKSTLKQNTSWKQALCHAEYAGIAQEFVKPA